MRRGREEPLLAAAVKAAAFEAVRVGLALAEQRGDGVGELNFAAHAALDVFQGREDFGLEHIAADHGQRRGSRFGRGLFNHRAHARGRLHFVVHAHDAVLARVLTGDVLHGQHAAAAHFGAGGHQLPEGGLLGVNEVIGQNHTEGLVADHGAGAQHGVPEAERLGLTDKDEVDAARRHGVHQIEKLVLALGRQIGLQFRALVEVILDGALVAARDKNHVGDAGRGGFLHGVLDQGLVDHRQHFLGHGLGGGQKTGAHAGNREHNFTNGLHNSSFSLAARPANAQAASF